MLDHRIFSGDPVRILLDNTGLLIKLRQVRFGGHVSEMDLLFRFVCILSVHSLIVARILPRQPHLLLTACSSGRLRVGIAGRAGLAALVVVSKQYLGLLWMIGLVVV